MTVLEIEMVIAFQKNIDIDKIDIIIPKPEYIYSMKPGLNAFNSCCQSWLQSFPSNFETLA